MAALTDKPANVIPFDSQKTMSCPYCGGDHPIPLTTKEHLIVTLDMQDKIHVHGCIHNPVAIGDFIRAICIETVKYNTTSTVKV